MNSKTLSLLLLLTAALPAAAQAAQEPVLNLYSSRHYQTDEALYANFTKQTGIKINRIEAGEDPLIERLKNEGANSPADVLITVDAGAPRGAPSSSGSSSRSSRRCSSARIPAHLRDPRPMVRLLDPRARHRLQQGDGESGGRRRTTRTSPNPKLKGKVCTRSGSHRTTCRS